MRCKACDNILRPQELRWHEQQQELEDMCLQCRTVVAVSMQELDMVFSDEVLSAEELIDNETPNITVQRFLTLCSKQCG